MVVGVLLVLEVLVAGATAGPSTGILVHGCHLQATGLCPAAELRAACCTRLLRPMSCSVSCPLSLNAAECCFQEPTL